MKGKIILKKSFQPLNAVKWKKFQDFLFKKMDKVLLHHWFEENNNFCLIFLFGRCKLTVYKY